MPRMIWSACAVGAAAWVGKHTQIIIAPLTTILTARFSGLTIVLQEHDGALRRYHSTNTELSQMRHYPQRFIWIAVAGALLLLALLTGDWIRQAVDRELHSTGARDFNCL